MHTWFDLHRQSPGKSSSRFQGGVLRTGCEHWRRTSVVNRSLLPIAGDTIMLLIPAYSLQRKGYTKTSWSVSDCTRGYPVRRRDRHPGSRSIVRSVWVVVSSSAFD